MGLAGTPSWLRWKNLELLYRVGVRAGDAPSFLTLRSDVSARRLALLGRYFSHYRPHLAQMERAARDDRFRLHCRSCDGVGDADLEATPGGPRELNATFADAAEAAAFMLGMRFSVDVRPGGRVRAAGDRPRSMGRALRDADAAAVRVHRVALTRHRRAADLRPHAGDARPAPDLEGRAMDLTPQPPVGTDLEPNRLEPPLPAPDAPAASCSRSASRRPCCSTAARARSARATPRPSSARPSSSARSSACSGRGARSGTAFTRCSPRWRSGAVTLREGVICILFSLPLVVPETILGALCGSTIRRYVHDRRRRVGAAALLVLAGVGWQVIDGRLDDPAHHPLHHATSTTLIAAPPERVFAALTARPLTVESRWPWFISVGLPMPSRFSVDAPGPDGRVTAVFSHGVARGHVTEWVPGRVLAFQIDRYEIDDLALPHHAARARAALRPAHRTRRRLADAAARATGCNQRPTVGRG